jgi:hypothetical protein
MRRIGKLAALIALGSQFVFVVQAPIASAAVGDTDSAITFNGSSNYLSKTDSAFGYRSTFTVQGWIRPTEVSCANNCTIFSHDADYIISIVAGKFQLWQYYNYNNITGQLDTGIQAKINEWQHIAYTYSSGTQKIYLNGQLVWQNTIAGWSSNPTYWGNYPFKLGYHYSSSYFYGQMDEVRLYSTTRTESEIAADMHRWGPATASGLVAYYDMNDFSGSTISNKLSGSTSSTTLSMTGPLTSYAIESTTTSSGFTTTTFNRSYMTSSGGFKTPSGVSDLYALVAGGGGGGGFDAGGGGGGGGVYQNSALSITENTFYEVVVGVGGKGSTGYTGGAGYCNGSWNGSVIGCSGGTGGTSKFGNVLASGGGGGGGIEANGLADSDASANARGGGGGAGGQNSRSGLSTGGVGAFTGGGTVDATNNFGGGGASGTANGSNGTNSAGGNGATGTTATINSLVYGSGGAGGNYLNANLATGGSGAGNGGTSSVAATNPIANRGGGGGGGGNGGVSAVGTAGAFGVIILKWALKGTAELAISGTPIYRVATTLTATTNIASKLTFYANNIKIAGCVGITTSANSATCRWKPSQNSRITLSVQISPTDSNYSSQRIYLSPVLPTRRVTPR